MTDFAPEIESWTARPDGQWDVLVTRGAIEERRWVEPGRLPADLFREAQQETAAKALKRMKKSGVLRGNAGNPQ